MAPNELKKKKKKVWLFHQLKWSIYNFMLQNGEFTVNYFFLSRSLIANILSYWQHTLAYLGIIKIAYFLNKTSKTIA